MEWRGSSQFAYLGYEIAPEVEDLLNEVEDLLEFDLFQNFLVAELAPESTPAPRHVDPCRHPAPEGARVRPRDG